MYLKYWYKCAIQVSAISLNDQGSNANIDVFSW